MAKDAEYEVESIQKAKTEKHGKKIRFVGGKKFHVRWKGWGPGDDTWEPIASFAGSQHLVDAFWERANHKGRDYKDLSQFTADEEFFVVGRPKPKANASSSSSKTRSQASTSRPPLESKDTTASSGRRKRRLVEEEVSTSERATRSSKRRRNQSEEAPIEEPEEFNPLFDGPSEPARQTLAPTEVIDVDDLMSEQLGTRVEPLDNAIPVKSRIGRNMSARQEKTAPKDKASLLTFTKTGPKIIKGRRARNVTPPLENAFEDSSLVPSSFEAQINYDHEQDDAPPATVDEYAQDDAPPVHDDLSDFEDTMAVDPTPPNSGPGASFLSKSVAAIRNHIFTPLWLGKSASQGSLEDSSDSSASLPFLLPLDISVSLPLIFHAPADETLDSFRVAKGGNMGISGKLYGGVHVHSLLNSVRCEGVVAKATLTPDASAEAKIHFQNFSSQLESNKLASASIFTTIDKTADAHQFVCPMGLRVFAICSTKCPDISQRFNATPVLLSAPGELLVTCIAIAHPSGFADVTGHAESTTW